LDSLKSISSSSGTSYTPGASISGAHYSDVFAEMPFQICLKVNLHYFVCLKVEFWSGGRIAFCGIISAQPSLGQPTDITI
jgi:hypothetical protein